MRNGLADSMCLDCRVYFLMREPELWVTIAWDGWEGQRALARYCLHRRSRLSSIGSILVSVCRCADEALWWQPVAILRAVFWMVRSLLRLSWEAIGAQMGAG